MYNNDVADLTVVRSVVESWTIARDLAVPDCFFMQMNFSPKVLPVDTTALVMERL